MLGEALEGRGGGRGGRGEGGGGRGEGERGEGGGREGGGGRCTLVRAYHTQRECMQGCYYAIAMLVIQHTYVCIYICTYRIKHKCYGAIYASLVHQN